MAELKTKIENALNEVRILILGAQVLLGFQFRSFFEPGFERLPEHSRYLLLAGLALMLIVVALLITPSAYHRQVWDGEDTRDQHSVTTIFADIALFPFAAGIALNIFIAAEKIYGFGTGVVIGGAAGGVAIFFWYGLEMLARRTHRHESKEAKGMKKKRPEAGGTELKEKIKHALTEVRTVLPGIQALLGFQFATILMQAFDRLPESSKQVHLISLLLVALSTILLMTPAAYHRIVERGEDTNHFHRFTGRMLLASMIPLALGVSGDFFVVVRKVTNNDELAIGAGAAAALMCFGLWFGFTLLRRGRLSSRRQRPGGPDAQAAE